MLTVFSHKIAFLFRVQVMDLDLSNVPYPYPILTEAGLELQAENGQVLATDGGIFIGIPTISGGAQPQSLHVVLED